MYVVSESIVKEVHSMEEMGRSAHQFGMLYPNVYCKQISCNGYTVLRIDRACACMVDQLTSGLVVKGLRTTWVQVNSTNTDDSTVTGVGTSEVVSLCAFFLAIFLWKQRCFR